MALLCNMAAPPKSVSGQVMGTKHPSPWKGGMGQASPYSAGTHVTNDILYVEHEGSIGWEG